jgi:hypothetical protein
MGHPGARPAAPTWARHAHLVDQGEQLGGVGVLAGREAGGQVAAPAVTDGMQLGGQPTA